MGRSCHTEDTCNGSLCKRMGGKHYHKARESTQSSEPQLGEGAFTHHGSSYGHGAASLWQTSWSSENTGTSALQHQGQQEREGCGEKRSKQREQHKEQMRKGGSYSGAGNPSFQAEIANTDYKAKKNLNTCKGQSDPPFAQPLCAASAGTGEQSSHTHITSTAQGNSISKSQCCCL